MGPIRYAGVVAFVDWISRMHPEINSLRNSSQEEFLALATEFEASKGSRIDETNNVFLQWRSTHWVFSQSRSDQEALRKLRKFG